MIFIVYIFQLKWWIEYFILLLFNNIHLILLDDQINFYINQSFMDSSL